MQVPEFTEDHPYWGTLRQSQLLNLKSKAANTIDDRLLINNGESPTQQLGHGGQKARGRRRKGMSTVGRSRAGGAREKRFGLADPVVWDAISRTLDQQRRLSTFAIPEEQVTASSIQELGVPSRTSSQRKALNRFTRQLEKYADAAGAASKVPVMTPTESESKMSYHTIQQLLPYQKEFQDAGLAVTSVEQSQRSPPKPRDSRVSIGRPQKSVTAPMQMSFELDGQDDSIDEQSCSTSGSFVEFTPTDRLIESLPSPKSKSKQRSPSKEKKGIFPWLRKKPPVKETRNSQHQQQQMRPPIKNGRVQNRVNTIDSQNPRSHYDSHPRRGPSVRVLDTATSVPWLPRSGNSSLNVATRHAAPSGALPSAGVKRTGLRERQVPVHSGAGPGSGSRPPVAYTGLRKRDMGKSRPPRPETIEEETETSAIHVDQKKMQIYPPPKSDNTQVLTPPIRKQSRDASQHTTPSTVPSLPYPARYASSRPSSLERALDEVSQQLEQMEKEADKSTELYSRPPTLVEKTNQMESRSFPLVSDQQSPGTALPRRPRKNEEVIYVNRKMPSIQSPAPIRKVKIPSPSPSRPTRDPTTPPEKRPVPKPLEDKILPMVPRMEAVLNDLDVFFDYDDADINDRDVIKGLQVAIHAAADNAYDAYIRDKTGLRIRRFLADLRAVGEMQQENPTNQDVR